MHSKASRSVLQPEDEDEHEHEDEHEDEGEQKMKVNMKMKIVLPGAAGVYAFIFYRFLLGWVFLFGLWCLLWDCCGMVAWLLVNKEYGIWNMEYGIRNMEYGIRNMEYGIWNTEYGIRNMDVCAAAACFLLGVWCMLAGLCFAFSSCADMGVFFYGCVRSRIRRHHPLISPPP